MKKTVDFGQGTDLQIGDIVWIRAAVCAIRTSSDPMARDAVPDVNPLGDVKVMFFPKRGYDEYAAPHVNAIFLRRSRWNRLRRVWWWIRGETFG